MHLCALAHKHKHTHTWELCSSTSCRLCRLMGSIGSTTQTVKRRNEICIYLLGQSEWAKPFPQCQPYGCHNTTWHPLLTETTECYSSAYSSIKVRQNSLQYVCVQCVVLPGHRGRRWRRGRVHRVNKHLVGGLIRGTVPKRSPKQEHILKYGMQQSISLLCKTAVIWQWRPTVDRWSVTPMWFTSYTDCPSSISGCFMPSMLKFCWKMYKWLLAHLCRTFMRVKVFGWTLISTDFQLTNEILCSNWRHPFKSKLASCQNRGTSCHIWFLNT